MKFTIMIQFTNMIFATNQIIFKDLASFVDLTFIDPFKKFQITERSASNDKKPTEMNAPDMSILTRLSKQASGFYESQRNSESYGLV